MVGLAGCLSSAKSIEGDNIQRHVSIANQDSLSDSYQLAIDAELLEDTITDSHTARLRITTTNNGPKRSLSVGTENCAIFNRRDKGSSPSGIWLYRPNEMEDTDRKGSKWVPEKSSTKPRVFFAYGCLPEVYETGEAVSTEYEVWHDYREEGYLDPGIYRWEQSIEIWNSPQVNVGEQSSTDVTWGFSLTVEKPKE